jgi:peptide/nickel transport system substrate-binding protein
MKRLAGWPLAAMLAFVVAFAVAACGGDDDDEDGAAGGRTGGTIRVAHASFPDFLDPAQSYTVDGWEALNLAYPGLLTYKRGESGQAGAEVVPALAEDLPEVSEDGRTYTFQLRDGLRFSDGKPLRASDFKASIERILHAESQGAGLGYTNIVGGEDILGKPGRELRGIEADDASGRITIKLVEPRGPFLYELAIPFAGVVPKGTSEKNQTKNPPPGAGRYMFEDVQPSRSYRLVKNPNFSESLKGTDVDHGKPDAIEARVQTENNSVTQIVQGRLDFMVDNPPPDRAAELRSRYADRFRQFATNSTFFFFMNSSVPPFDDLKVRQAVNHAIDPEAINRVQGGTISPAHTTLPPGVPGHDANQEDLYPHDLNKAKQLIQEAGVEGDEVTVWGNPENPTKQTVEYYADVLEQIGFKTNVRIVPGETYFTTVGDKSVKAQTGWYNWFQDYPHPADFIDILLNPNNVQDKNNNNVSYNEHDKRLAAMIEELNKETELTDEVKQRWAEVDRYLQEQAYWAIYGNRKQTTFFSERMDFENCKGEHPVWTHDWSQFCLK